MVKPKQRSHVGRDAPPETAFQPAAGSGKPRRRRRTVQVLLGGPESRVLERRDTRPPPVSHGSTLGPRATTPHRSAKRLVGRTPGIRGGRRRGRSRLARSGRTDAFARYPCRGAASVGRGHLDQLGRGLSTAAIEREQPDVRPALLRALRAPRRRRAPRAEPTIDTPRRCGILATALGIRGRYTSVPCSTESCEWGVGYCRAWCRRI
jgi:hypothetical protein